MNDINEQNLKVTRTMNNSLIIGETTEQRGITKIGNPFAMIPLEEGLRVIPLDIDLLGIKMDEITLTEDKIMYSIRPSEIIIKEYLKLRYGPSEEDKVGMEALAKEATPVETPKDA